MELTTLSILVAVAVGFTTILGTLFKAKEFIRSRRLGLRVEKLLTGSPQIGNSIILLNSSNVPVNIYYYDLVWAKAGFFGRHFPFLRREVRSESPIEADTCDITVPPHGQDTILFTDEDHFDWGGELKEDIYIRLWLVRRKSPVWFLVTGPGK